MFSLSQSIKQILENRTVRKAEENKQAKMLALAKRLRNANNGIRSKPSEQQLSALLSCLKGSGDQISWTDLELQKQTVLLVWDYFCDDWFWCIQAMLAIYFINPTSIEQITDILEEHNQSRFGLFPQDLYEGKGWSPADALNFVDDSKRYLRCYRAYTNTDWTSFALRSDTKDLAELWKDSGYKFTGTKGCVKELTLSFTVLKEEAEARIPEFVSHAERLLDRACPGVPPAGILKSIKEHRPLAESFAPLSVAFFIRVEPRDPRERYSKDNLTFVLKIKHE